MVLNAITLGFIFSLLGFGIFLSFKVLNYTDLTAEASFTVGAAISVVFARMGLPFLGLPLAMAGGAVAGLITGLLHTKLGIEKVLSGILTLTAFYTINLLVTNFQPNISLPKDALTVFVYRNDWANLAIAAAFSLAVGFLLTLFFRTRIGLKVRATGDNENMVKSIGANTDAYKLLGLALSNAIIALSGALFMNYERYYDASFGTGMMVVGVVTIIIGEVLTLKKHYLSLMLIGIVLGSIAYRFLYMGVLYFTNQPQFMKLISAASIVIFIIIGRLRPKKKPKKGKEAVPCQ